MKKFLALLTICVMLVMTLASCGILFPSEQPGGEHEHVFLDGKCECGESDPNYVAPHEHNFVEGKCECGESDPDYVAPHEHSFVDGKCECGESDPDYVAPHEHSFVDGKCECGESDPNYKPEPEKVLAENIFVDSEDEIGDGSYENPYNIYLAQGQSVSVNYVVQPKEATDKSLTWSVVGEGTGLTFSDTGTKLTITAAADATTSLVEGKTNDGSDLTVYFKVTIESYTPVTGITSSTLKADDGEYDYVFVTALGTKWDMSGDPLKRGQQLLNGEIFGGSQAPRNITYWPLLQNFGLQVSPADATNTAVIVSYSNEGIIKLDVDGTWTALKAGETVITVSSYSEPDVKVTIKVVVKDALYNGILLEDYNNATVSGLTSWDLDADHNTAAQFARYDDWHLVMIHSNSSRGAEGDDGNQKIFYMGQSDRPYGICLENRIDKNSGGSLTSAASLMWAKLQIPAGAETFNIKIGNNDKVHGQYRVLFVTEDGAVTELTSGWIGFVSGPSESTQKLEIPEALQGVTGAMVVEHRLTEYDNNAELQIKVMKFEGYNPVTSVQLKKTEGTYKPGQAFAINASAKPDNATNDALIYYVAEGSADKGVTVDANGNVTIAENTAGGVYVIVVAAAENPAVKAEFKLTVTAEEIVPNKWEGKSDILNGVQGVKWTIVGETDAGVGEGADLKVTGNNTWSSLKLDDKKITSNSFILTFGARVFHRNGETYPKFVIKVNGEVVRGVGQSEDWFYVDTDATQYCSYDLSKWMGQRVTVEIGITQGTHAVVQYIEFSGTDAPRAWENKSELKDANLDPWAHKGDSDAGVGEGYDIMHTGTYLYNSFLIGAGYNSQFTFGGRVFHRSGETYPEVYLVVVDAKGTEHRITAIGAENDYVYFDTDAIQHFTYDLSAFAGQTVEIRILLKNNATHCVITDIKMEGNVPEHVEPELEPVTEWVDKADLQDKNLDPWAHKGDVDAGVGEGYDIIHTGSYLYNEFLITKGHNSRFTFGGRVFHRNGETYPEVYLVVVDANGEEHRITAIGADKDYVYFDTDAPQHFTYDLSAFDGQRVEIRIVLKNNATHCVITDIKMSAYEEPVQPDPQPDPQPTVVTSWKNKTELKEGNDPWILEGNTDAGVGEGFDIKNTGSNIYNEFPIIKGVNNYITFGIRVFHRNGETYPDVAVMVRDENGGEHIIRAIGADKDYVHVDTDAIQHFTYDLSQFEGQTIIVAIGLMNNATHCVITDITMAGAAN